MFNLRGFDNQNSSTYKERVTHNLDRRFQARYASIAVVGALAGCLLSVAPVYHYIQQNYAVFSEIAEKFAPPLIENLDRERIWVSALLILGFLGLTLFFIFLGLRVTHRIVGPVWVLRNHIRRLARGQWSIPPVKIRESDEFHDLIETYNYFYEAFRANLFRELELLKQMKVSRDDKTSFHAWRTLIEEKNKQLNINPLSASHDVKNEKFPDSRRVS